LGDYSEGSQTKIIPRAKGGLLRLARDPLSDIFDNGGRHMAGLQILGVGADAFALDERVVELWLDLKFHILAIG
jgi:hypothetical protein